MKKRDILVLIGGIIIVTALWLAPDETTSHVPKNETHLKYYEIAHSEGKKTAEKFCQECHNAEQVKFPADHPPKFRCLLCHKLAN